MIGLLIRTQFALTSQRSATRSIQMETERTLSCIHELGDDDAQKSVDVGKMIGVDEDMRRWTPYQTLEHNTIVNRVIQEVVTTLARGEVYVSDFDPKTDVLPGAAPNVEMISAFRSSVDDYLQAVGRCKQLRGTPRYPHPLFGRFNAHQWHCMFGFHLRIHRRQLERGIQRLRDS